MVACNAVTPVLLPEVPYHRTSVRPAWDELPTQLRECFAGVAAVRPAAAGFTPGFAAVLQFTDGSSRFVKAIAKSNPLSAGYLAEARFAAALPPSIPMPALLWSEELAGHVVLCFEAIEGAHTPSLPWLRPELDAALDALAVTAQALAVPFTVEPNPFPSELLCQWRNGTVDHPRRGELTELEAAFLAHAADATGLMHCDVRLDNVIIDAHGKALLCDWSWLSSGPAWFDLVSLLISAEASGIDPDPLFFAHPTAAGLSDTMLDSALAAFLGYYLYSGAQPEIPTSPNLRGHQRYYARLTHRWLARRRGWATP